MVTFDGVGVYGSEEAKVWLCANWRVTAGTVRATGEATGANVTAACNASLNSCAEAKRSSERLRIATCTTLSTVSEMPGSMERADGVCWRTCLSSTSTGVWPVKGG